MASIPESQYNDLQKRHENMPSNVEGKGLRRT